MEAVQVRIVRAAEQADRNPGEIAVVAVTKTRLVREVEAALQSGLWMLGENRVQEAEIKKPQVAIEAEWHLIGTLQSNKVRKAVALFDVVQSVDRVKVAEALDRCAADAGRMVDILLQVNTSGAVGQSGTAPDQLESLAEQVAALPNLRLRGLMTIGALSQNEGVVRGCFGRLRELRERLGRLHLDRADLHYLSMGMSGDFEWAIAEGANMLRLGNVLFGPRST